MIATAPPTPTPSPFPVRLSNPKGDVGCYCPLRRAALTYTAHDEVLDADTCP